MLDIIHRFVETLDQFFGNVCELDLIFNFPKAYAILDEVLLAGEMQESSKKAIIKITAQQEAIQQEEEDAKLRKP